jgi:hypothetical protein
LIKENVCRRALCGVTTGWRGWALARAQFAALVDERDCLREQLEATRQSLQDSNDALREVTDALRELKAAVSARWAAEARLADLYREREIARASAIERDLSAMLN